MPREAFVTGATGFIGRNVVEQLVLSGWRVTALHRPNSRLRDLVELPIVLRAGDILDPVSLSAAIPEGGVTVFHVAADTTTWSKRSAEQTRTNVEGTRNVVEAALARGAACLVHTSTWNVFGIEHGAITEGSPLRGLDSSVNYDRSKALAEGEVRRGIDRGLRAVILNPSHVIGRYDRRNWSRMVTMVHEGRLPGVPSGSGTFAHAEQVARAHVTAAERGGVGKNYLLGGADATFVEVFRTIGELTGRKVPSKPLPAFLTKSVGALQAMAAVFTGREPEVTPAIATMVTSNPRIDSDAAVRDLGYENVPLRLMLADCVEWMRSEGMLRQ